MLKIFMVILIFVLLFAWEASQLIRKREMKELIVFSILSLIGLVMSIVVIIQSFI
ncbi:hypothetical protein IEC97_04300 [Neobacillus cucumis]|uniref:hypothetical protein n=1 Tax=Neobacillus cucumis TaxID=1740721 RepID=UPI0018DFA53D|nr:hypothetical protein [Neobacillus cucumis]MBI0576576.1 hypothetical protein [Neobacillus cucumis]